MPRITTLTRFASEYRPAMAWVGVALPGLGKMLRLYGDVHLQKIGLSYRGKAGAEMICYLFGNSGLQNTHQNRFWIRRYRVWGSFGF